MHTPGLGSNETRKLIEITPKNYDQFFPKVYSELTLPASALIFVGKEPKQEISKLEELRAECEKINLSALIDLSKNTPGIVDKYGVDTSELKENLKKHQLLREKYLLDLLKARGYPVEFNEETRVASIKYGDKKLYGSVYSLLDTSPELVSFEWILREFETQDSPNRYENIMSFFTDEGYSYRVLNSVTGSYAQTEISPFPSDFDFNELLQINSESESEGIEIFRNIILKNFEKFKDNPNSIITKFKMGKFRIKDISGNIQEIKMDWTYDEVLEGRKIIIVDGLELEVTFEENVKGLTSEDFIKFDLITNITGVYRHCEKLVDLRIINKSEETIFEHSFHPHSPLMEVFFDDPSKFKKIESVTNNNVLYDFSIDMINDFFKYSDCGEDGDVNCNPLKAVKRAYNLLKSFALIQQGRDFSRLLFSDYAKLSQISETLHTYESILNAFQDEKNNKKSFFDLENIKESFQNFIEDLDKYQSNDSEFISRYVKIILNRLNTDNPNIPKLIELIRKLQKKIKQSTSSVIYNELLKQKNTLGFLDTIYTQINL